MQSSLVAPSRKPNSPPAYLLGAINQLCEGAQQAVDNTKNRDVWELARLLFTPDVCKVLRMTQPKPWVPPGEGEFAFQTKGAANYRDHWLQKRDNPYQDPRPAILELTLSQQHLRAFNEEIKRKAQLAKQIKEEARQAQQVIYQQSVKNKEFNYLRKPVLELTQNSGIEIPEPSVSTGIVPARGEVSEGNDVHMVEEPEAECQSSRTVNLSRDPASGLS